MEPPYRTEIVLPLRLGPETDNQSIAAAIAAAMERDLPPDAAARVTVDGPPGALGAGEGASITLGFSGVEAGAMPLPRLAPRGRLGAEGRLTLLRLRLEDVRLPEGALDLVEMSFPGAGYWFRVDGDRTYLRLVDLPDGTAQVSLSTASLCQLVSARAPTIANPQIRLTDGGWVEATGSIRLGVFPARARLRGRIVPRAGNSLCIESLELGAGSLALPAPLVRSVEMAVNPFVDLARDVPLPFDVRIVRVTTQDDTLRLDAHVRPLMAELAKED